MMSALSFVSLKPDNAESPRIFTAISNAFNFWSKVKTVFCFISSPINLSADKTNKVRGLEW